MVVSVVDSVEELSGLWQEGSDLAITPTRQNALAVSHELNCVAFKAWYFNSKQFLTSVGIPDTDIVH